MKPKFTNIPHVNWKPNATPRPDPMQILNARIRRKSLREGIASRISERGLQAASTNSVTSCSNSTAQNP